MSNSEGTIFYENYLCTVLEKEAIVDLNDADKDSEKAPPNKWLELERTLPAVVNTHVNADLTLECVAVGSPPPRVYWLKDDKHVSSLICMIEM